MYYFYLKNGFEFHLRYSDSHIKTSGWVLKGIFSFEDIISEIAQIINKHRSWWEFRENKTTIQKKLFASSWKDMGLFFVLSEQGRVFAPEEDIVVPEFRYPRYWGRSGKRKKWRKPHYRMYSLLKDSKNPENKEYIRNHYDYAFWEDERYYQERIKSWKNQSKKRKQWM